MIKKLLATLAALAMVAGGLVAASPAQAAPKDKPTVGVVAPKGAPPIKPGTGVSTRSLTTCPGSPAKCYSYVAGSQAVTNTGAAGTFEVGAPYLKSTDYHSLAENAVIRDDGSGIRQIVELGWTVDPVVNGNSTPALFVYSWKNGATSCYNGCGYVDYAANTTVYAGMPLTAGQQMAYRILYDSTTPAGGAWWIWVDPDAGGATAGNWIGYFPQSVWSGLAVPFTSANGYQLFFELAHTTVESCSDMGNGQQGSGGAGASPRPSFIASAAYFSGGSWVNGSLINFLSPVTTKWTYNAPSVRTFYGGGPGWNSAGTATGTPGSC